jgi:nucleoside-diphosphate-sugar epimerase
MKKLLITGARGFIGSAITEKLAAEGKYEIYAVISGLQRAIPFAENVKIVCADLLNESERCKLIESIMPTFMFHFAWETSDLASSNNIKWLEASLHLARLFWDNGGKRFLFAGTGYEYSYNSGKALEYSPWQLNSGAFLYGICKHAFTTVSEQFARENNHQYVTARYFSIYGEGDDKPKRAIPSAIQSFLSGQKFICKSPNNIADYIYIDDAVDATIKTFESDFCGVINIASGLPQRMYDVFADIASILGRQELLFAENESICQSILVGDTNILNNKISYFCPTSLHAGLEKTIKWWKEYKI